MASSPYWDSILLLSLSVPACWCHCNAVRTGHFGYYCGSVCVPSFLVSPRPRGGARSGSPVTCVGVFLCVFWALSLSLLWTFLWSVVHWIHRINPLDFIRMQSMSLFMSRKFFLWIIAELVSEVPSEPRGSLSDFLLGLGSSYLVFPGTPR